MCIYMYIYACVFLIWCRHQNGTSCLWPIYMYCLCGFFQICKIAPSRHSFPTSPRRHINKCKLKYEHQDNKPRLEWSCLVPGQRESVGGLAPAYITTGHLHTSQPSNDSPTRVSMLDQCSKKPNKHSLATLAANLPRKPAISPTFLLSCSYF